MSDRTCPKCNNIFTYPSRLKKHFENVIHCKKTEEDILELSMIFSDSEIKNELLEPLFISICKV